MIKGTFKLGAEVIEVIIRDDDLLFGDIQGTVTTIEGLKLNKAGVIKEFPDLEDDKEWKEKAIKRLKEHIKKFKTEMEQLNYIREELMKHGYTPLFLQRAGFRTQSF